MGNSKTKLLMLSAAIMVVFAAIFIIITNTGAVLADAAKPQTTEGSMSAAGAQAPSGTPDPAVRQNQTGQDQSEQDKPLSRILADKGITDLGTDVKIVISKSSQTLSLVYKGETIKSYHVELGEGGKDDKQVEGDKKTPEGTFYVTSKEVMDPPDYYLGSRWLGVSYPNIEDAERGLQQGLIDNQTYDEIVNAVNNGENPPQDTALGGNIGIHGGSVPAFGSNWTWGCIGLKNSDIDDFYGYISSGTPIVIEK